VTIKPTVNVYRFVNPFKSVKADGKKLKLQKGELSLKVKYVTKKKKIKVSLRLKKGWKVKSVTTKIIVFETADMIKYKTLNCKLSGLTQRNPDSTYYEITAVNKKTKVSEKLVLEIATS